MKWLLKFIPIKIKIWLYKVLYKDIAKKGECEDKELAHINDYEAQLLNNLGGSGSVNKVTGLKGYFGGGGGGGPAPAPAPAAPAVQTQISREAPEVESRKLALYDEAIDLATQPIAVPEYQVAGPAPLERQGFTIAGTAGVGRNTLTSGIGSTLQASQLASTGPNIEAFMNPYQRFVIDEINRQADMRRNELSAQAVGAGAFGGGREGVERAEQERARLAQIGQAQAAGFGTALQAAQQQQQFQTQTALNVGSQLANQAQREQQMQQADVQQALQAGQIQRDIAQKALEAQRATELARAYEPYQRIEFQKGIMTQLPTAASQVTQTTSPGANPFAQAVGAGIGAYAAYNLLGNMGGKGTQ